MQKKISPCSIKQYKKSSKVGDRSRGRLEGSLFNSYCTKLYERALLLSLDCSTLPSIHTLYCWVLIKEVSSTIFNVFGMTRPGIEPRSPGPLANTLPIRPKTISKDFESNTNKPQWCRGLFRTFQDVRNFAPLFSDFCNVNEIYQF